MNIFKNNSTRLFGLSTEYPHTVDKEFPIMHGRNNLNFKFHVHGGKIFYRWPHAAPGCAALM